MTTYTKEQGPIQFPTSTPQQRNGHVGNGRLPHKRKCKSRLRELTEAVNDVDEGDHVRQAGSCSVADPEGPAAEGNRAIADHEDGDGDDSWLVDPDAENDAEGEDASSDADTKVAPGDNDWYKTEACKLVARQGSEKLPGNRNLRVPLWILHYFRNIEMAVVFAQILYWFGRTKDGKRRATREDKQGRTVVDKTHRQLADELGIPNERRVENCLRSFANRKRKEKKKGNAEHAGSTKGTQDTEAKNKEKEQIKLLDYRTTGMGKGRTTRIWLIPEGILEAYKIGCRRLEGVEWS